MVIIITNNSFYFPHLFSFFIAPIIVSCSLGEIEIKVSKLKRQENIKAKFHLLCLQLMTKRVVTTVLPTKEHSKSSSVRQKELRRAQGCLVMMKWQKDSFNRGTYNEC